MYFLKETCEPQFTAFTLDCILILILVLKTEDQSEAREIWENIPLLVPMICFCWQNLNIPYFPIIRCFFKLVAFLPGNRRSKWLEGKCMKKYPPVLDDLLVLVCSAILTQDEPTLYLSLDRIRNHSQISQQIPTCNCDICIWRPRSIPMLKSINALQC